MEEKNLSKGKKIIDTVVNIVVWVFVAFATLVTVLVFSSQNSEDGVPSIFGKSYITIATPSMKPTFNVDDLIIIEKVEDGSGLSVGDIITFTTSVDIDNDGYSGDINTHKIIEVNLEGGYYVTQGENNLLPDNVGDNPYVVYYNDVIGVYTGTNLGGVGKIIKFLQSSLGFFLCVVLPMIIFFLFELYNFISMVIKMKMEKEKENNVNKAVAETDEETKRKIIEEYLKQQAENKKE